MKKTMAVVFMLRRPLLAILEPFLSIAAMGAAIVAVRRFLQQEADLHGQVALITGGSRGLGLLLAQRFGLAGCRLVICARDEDELLRAAEQLRRHGASVLAMPCDVSDADAVQRMVQQASAQLGGIDILVNNAGIMDLGALPVLGAATFEDALDVMFWGMLHPTLAVLPQMRARRAGRIVNIASIGGKIAVPHLMPYSTAKFAAVGFSEGLRAELAGEGIAVTTIIPGLMRTGSFLNALFHGQKEKEFSWFALGSTLPLISMDAGRAAEQIVQATRRGEAERTLGLPAVLLARLQGLAPGLTADLLGLAGRLLLPAPGPRSAPRQRGWEIQQQLSPRQRQALERLTVLGQEAARRLNQLSPAETAAGD
jgi:NAD(P)-dependent dehydrogenase (short-subunit alcohol dehydrogenase family)